MHTCHPSCVEELNLGCLVTRKIIRKDKNYHFYLHDSNLFHITKKIDLNVDASVMVVLEHRKHNHF